MKCERVEELLIDYLAGEIEPQENKIIQAHLQQCHNCSTKYEEFKQIQSAFRSETLPEPSKDLLQNLSAKARQDLRHEHVPFWRKWFYSPILIPTLTTAIALMIWINVGGDNTSEFGDFDDQPEYYSREVMAEKIPQQEIAGKAIVKGQGNFRAKDDLAGRKQNAPASASNIAEGERRRDAAAPSLRGETPERQERSFKKVPSSIAGKNERSAEQQKSAEQARQKILDELENKKTVEYENQAIAKDSMNGVYNEQSKPQSPAAPADPNKKDDDGFSFSLGSSKVMAKKVYRPSGDVELDSVGRDNKELADQDGHDYATSAKVSEQVRSAEKTEKLKSIEEEDSRLIAVDTPKELADKDTLKQLGVALKQQRAGDCESAIATNEYNLKNSPGAPASVKEQTYLSLAQCYEQQNMFVKAIENYNYLQQVSPSQKPFATQKIEELNFKVQNMNVPAVTEPSTTSETGVEVTK